MSYTEFIAWQAYDQLDPFGEQRADLRNAMLMALMANANRNPKKQRTPFKVEQFMPKFDQREEPVDWRVMKMRFQSAAAAANRSR